MALLLLIFCFKIFLSIAEESNSILLNDFRIHIKEDGQKFPKKFSIKIDNENLESDFEIFDNQIPPLSVFENGIIKQIDSPTESHQIYKNTNGNGYATLQSLSTNKTDGQNYKVYARIYSKNKQSVHYDIIPDKAKKLKRNSNRENKHVLMKRSLVKENLIFNSKIDDYISVPDIDLQTRQKEEMVQTYRALGNGPLVVDVETLLVADPSVYEYHKEFLGTTDDKIIFENMRLYYAYTMNGVNDKYQNSLENDPDLRINIKLVHILVYTNPNDATWTLTSKVGDSKIVKYKEREVILNLPVIHEFANAMKKINFKFDFDHAIAVVGKDLWSHDVSQENDERSINIGISWLKSVCNPDKKYSVVEELRGFQTVYVIAHEIAHNLGAHHDHGYLCNQNYLMNTKYNQSNVEALQKFSSCSIESFKNFILNGKDLSFRAFCLINKNNDIPEYVKNSDHSITGQIWDYNEQCKMKYGVSASLYQEKIVDVCQNLVCRKSLNDLDAYDAGPAADGTTCGSGLICLKGKCISHSKVPVSECPFGDDYVRTGYKPWFETPFKFLTCKDYFDIVGKSKHLVKILCDDTIMSKSFCCSSCLKYKLLECDGLENCKTLTCSSSFNPCRNGGTCKNSGLSEDGLIGFECECKKGFSGQICETKKITSTCSPQYNPCKNGGTCINNYIKNAEGFECECKGGFSGKLCQTIEKKNGCPTNFNPCKNEGICKNKLLDETSENGYECECLAGFIGQLCENKETSNTKGIFGWNKNSIIEIFSFSLVIFFILLGLPFLCLCLILTQKKYFPKNLKNRSSFSINL